MSRTRRGVLAGTVVALAGCNDGRTGVSIEFQSVDTSAVSGHGMPVDTTGELSTDAIEFTARVGENTATGFEILFELTNNRDDRLDYTDTWWRLWYREDAETRWTGTEVGARLLRELRLPPGETHTWRVQFEFGETAVETTDVTRNDRETVIRDVPARTGEFLFGVDLIESRPEEPALLLTRIVVDD